MNDLKCKIRSLGFTLIGVLAVIVILGLLVTLIIFNYDKIFNDISNDISDIEIKNVESAAQLYVTDNYSFNDEYEHINLTWNYLYELGVIKIDEYD